MGSTGRSTGPHLHIQGSSREAVVADTLKQILHFQKLGVEYIKLSNAKIDVTNTTDPTTLLAAINKEVDAHTARTRSNGGSNYTSDIAVPQGTPVSARVGTPFWDPNGGFMQTNLDNGLVYGHGTKDSTASGPAPTTDFTTKFARYLSNLEGGYGMPAGHRAKHPGSKAEGYFQMLPSTGDDLRRRGLGNVADDLMSNKFDIATRGMIGYARAQNKPIDELLKNQDLPGLFNALKGLWPSLPGGEQHNTAVNARAQKYLEGATAPPGATSASTAEEDANLAKLREGFEATTNKIGDLLKKSQELRKEILTADTAEAFANISKQLIPDLPLEALTQELWKQQEVLKLTAAASADAYDPERLQIAADKITKLKIMEEDKALFLKKAKESESVTAEELKKLEEDINKRVAERTTQLEKEAALRNQILDTTRQQAMITQVRQDVTQARASGKDQLLQLQNTLQQAFTGQDPYARRQLEAEQQLGQRRNEYDRQFKDTPWSAEAVAAYKELEKELRSNAETLGHLDTVLIAVAEKFRMIDQAVQGLTGPIKGFISGLTQGELDLREGLANMFREISGNFMDMALEQAFKPVEAYLTNYLKSALGIDSPEAAKDTALRTNTDALYALTKALGGAQAGAPTAANNISPFNSSAIDSYEEKLGNVDSKLVETAFSTDLLTGSLDKTADSALAGFQGLSSLASSLFSLTPSGGGSGGGGFGGLIGGLVSSAASLIPGIGPAVGAATSAWNPNLDLSSTLNLPNIFGARAAGGPNVGKRPYLVGEYGPEIHVPDSSGTYLANAETNNILRGKAGASPEDGASTGYSLASGGKNGSTSSERIERTSYNTREMVNNSLMNMREKEITESATALIGSSNNGTFSDASGGLKVGFIKVGEIDAISRSEYEKGLAYAENQGAKRGARQGVELVKKRMKNDPGYRKALR